MRDILGKHPDLMDGFNEFFMRCEKIGNIWNQFPAVACACWKFISNEIVDVLQMDFLVVL